MGAMIELAAKDLERSTTTVDLLDEHGAMLLAAARVITLDDAEAQDPVQTTFEIAIRHIGSLREPAALAAWPKVTRHSPKTAGYSSHTSSHIRSCSAAATVVA